MISKIPNGIWAALGLSVLVPLITSVTFCKAIVLISTNYMVWVIGSPTVKKDKIVPITHSVSCLMRLEIRASDMVLTLVAEWHHMIWWQRTGSVLVQVMNCCLTAPSQWSHYLNWCWLIICEVLWHSPEGNFTRNAQDIYWVRMNNQGLVWWRGISLRSGFCMVRFEKC